MEKIKVEICVGTTCFILGAAELQELERFLPDDLKDKVEISGAACLGMCKNANYGQAPFVRVGHTVIANAHVGTVIEQIRKELKGA